MENLEKGKPIEVVELGALVGKTGRIKGDKRTTRTIVCMQDFKNGLVSVIVLSAECDNISHLQSVPSKIFDWE